MVDSSGLEDKPVGITESESLRELDLPGCSTDITASLERTHAESIQNLISQLHTFARASSADLPSSLSPYEHHWRRVPLPLPL
jgi:hypothetical protein